MSDKLSYFGEYHINLSLLYMFMSKSSRTYVSFASGPIVLKFLFGNLRKFFLVRRSVNNSNHYRFGFW